MPLPGLNPRYTDQKFFFQFFNKKFWLRDTDSDRNRSSWKNRLPKPYFVENRKIENRKKPNVEKPKNDDFFASC